MMSFRTTCRLPANLYGMIRLVAKVAFRTVSEGGTVLKHLNKTNLRKFIYYFRTADPAVLEEKIEKRIKLNGGVERTESADDLHVDFFSGAMPDKGTLQWMGETSRGFKYKPVVGVVSSDEKTSASVTAQVYPFRRSVFFCESNPPADINETLMNLDCDFLCFPGAGDVLMPHAFFEFVRELNMNTGADLIYADEAFMKDSGRCDFFFKPDWSPELFLNMNYIGEVFLLRKELFFKAGGLRRGLSPEGIYDLLLRVTEYTRAIRHVPLMLHTSNCRSKMDDGNAVEILEEALTRRGIDGDVIPLHQPENAFRIKRNIAGNPLISIIIPTAFRKRGLLKKCLLSIVKKTSYKNYEIILAENSCGRLSSEWLEALIPASVPRQIIEGEEKFNYSRVNNIAARKAKGDYFIFLNDDTEIISPGWIEALLEHAQSREVGVVGGKLLYQDGTIQHGGVFLCDTHGGGRHAFRYFPGDSDGYHGLLKVSRNCSAVTFACAMVSRKVFLELGGIDENMAIECSDVDFCLRAVKSGYMVIWTPHCVLYHKELSTRVITMFKDDITFLWNRWQSLLEKGDPFYNPNLTLDYDNFSINTRPVLIEHHGSYVPSDKGDICHDPDLTDSEIIRKLSAVLSQSDFIVGIHPAAESAINQWPLNYFAELTDRLIQRDGATIVLFGEESEKAMARELYWQIHNRDRVLSLAGEISPEQFMAIVKYCDVFIGGNSEPVHIAGVLGVPALVLFGGQKLPRQWHTLEQKTTSIRVAVQCSPCYKSLPSDCPYDLACLKFLWPEKVLDGVHQLRMLSGKQNRSRGVKAHE